MAARGSSQAEQGPPPVSLEDVAAVLERLLLSIRQERPLLQQQLADVGGGLFSLRELEAELVTMLGLLHTWAATPDGAYSGGRIDERHAAAGRAAFAAALELSDSEFHRSAVLATFSNLLRRTGAEAEADAVLQRSLAAARASGDALQELNIATALFSVVVGRDAWSYAEWAALVDAMWRRLSDCKPWLPNTLKSDFKEVSARLAGNSRPVLVQLAWLGVNGPAQCRQVISRR